MALVKKNLQNVKDYVNDPILSLNAKGLLTQLIELEDGYDLNQEKIGKMNSNGRESIKSTFDELERNGYLVRTDSRDGGRYFKTDYTIYDKSIIPNRVNPKIKNARYLDWYR